MQARGQFGIGFFSVFMLGEQVSITTRRYDASESDALSLKFYAGLHSRPILSRPAPGLAPLDGGTRVEIKLEMDPRAKDRLRFRPIKGEPMSSPFAELRRNRIPQIFSSLKELVAALVPGSEVSIDVVEFEHEARAVNGGDWRTGPPTLIIDRIESTRYGEELSERNIIEQLVRPIIGADNALVGRAALWPTTWHHAGILVAGGLRVQTVPHIVGIMMGEVQIAARNQGRMLATPMAIQTWVSEQAKLIETSNLSEQRKAMSAEIILECGGAIGNLPIAQRGGTWFTVEELRDLIHNERRLLIQVGEIDYEDYDPVGRDIFNGHFTPSKELLFFPALSDLLLNTENRNNRRRPSYLLGFFEDLLHQIWGNFEEFEEDDYIVGTAWGSEITRSITTYQRAIPSS